MNKLKTRFAETEEIGQTQVLPPGNRVYGVVEGDEQGQYGTVGDNDHGVIRVASADRENGLGEPVSCLGASFLPKNKGLWVGE